MGAVAIEERVQTRRLNTRVMRNGVASALRISSQVFVATRQSNVLVSLLLVIILLASAIGVVVSAHKNRVLFNGLSQLHEERDDFQREWSQLLLEQSALSALGRVESLASTHFDMVVPGRQDIVLVPLTVPAKRSY
jgi:cell division protein FtsL